MPTSNGQVTARDIRQSAVKTLHLRDEAVATAKIEDLAVTVDKNYTMVDFDNVIDVAANASITTSWLQFATTDIDVPAWATRALFIVHMNLGLSITTSKTLNFTSIIDDEGQEPLSWRANYVTATGWRQTTHTRTSKRTVTPGSTITVGGWIKCTSGSNSNNQLYLFTGVVFARV